MTKTFYITLDEHTTKEIKVVANNKKEAKEMVLDWYDEKNVIDQTTHEQEIIEIEQGKCI
jgi:hypothetical protein